MHSCWPRPLCCSERSPRDGVFIAPNAARFCKRTATACRGSDSAPSADDLLVEGHRLADALHAAVLVGLVRELRLARAEHHGRRASIHLQQVARIGVVRGGARLGLRAEMAPADLEHALHPFLLRRGPYRRHVGEHVELRLSSQKLSYPGK